MRLMFPVMVMIVATGCYEPKPSQPPPALPPVAVKVDLAEQHRRQEELRQAKEQEALATKTIGIGDGRKFNGIAIQVLSANYGDVDAVPEFSFSDTTKPTKMLYLTIIATNTTEGEVFIPTTGGKVVDNFGNVADKFSGRIPGNVQELKPSESAKFLFAVNPKLHSKATSYTWEMFTRCGNADRDFVDWRIVTPVDRLTSD